MSKPYSAEVSLAGLAGISGALKKEGVSLEEHTSTWENAEGYKFIHEFILMGADGILRNFVRSSDYVAFAADVEALLEEETNQALKDLLNSLQNYSKKLEAQDPERNAEIWNILERYDEVFTYLNERSVEI